MRTHPYLGRMGAEPALRELLVAGTPYKILYRVHHGSIISTIWHAAQQR